MAEVAVEIDVGKHSHLVNDVLAFVSSKGLLQPAQGSNRADDDVLEWNVAKRLAWESVHGKEEFTWADLRSEKMSEVWELIYASEEGMYIDGQLSSLMEDVSTMVENQLDTKHTELFDDIVTDLKGCLYSRAVQGDVNRFFERILLIYKEGGWPCGWNGAWPSGTVMAYFPS